MLAGRLRATDLLNNDVFSARHAATTGSQSQLPARHHKTAELFGASCGEELR